MELSGDKLSTRRHPLPFLPVWLWFREHCFARAEQTLYIFPTFTLLTTQDTTGFSKETFRIKKMIENEWVIKQFIEGFVIQYCVVM